MSKSLSDVEPNGKKKKCKRNSSEDNGKEELFSNLEDLDLIFPQTHPDYFPQSQLLNFPESQPLDHQGSLNQDIDECGIYPPHLLKHRQPFLDKVEPSPLSCLKNRLDNTAYALTSLVWQLDVAYEEFTGTGTCSNRTELENSVTKIRQMRKQYVKFKKELERLFKLENL